VQQVSTSAPADTPNKTIVRFILLRPVLRFLSMVSPRFTVSLLAHLLMKPPRRAVDRDDLDALEGARRFTVWSDGRRLSAWSWGSGPTVLLVHGWGGRGAQLGDFVRPLVHAGRRVVAFDAPAHGRSDGCQSSVVDMARAVMDVAAVVGDVDAVIAHSAGGAATTLALQAGLTAKRLLYVAPALRPGGFLQKLMRLLGIEVGLRNATRAFMERRVGRSFDALHADVATPQPATDLLVVHDENDRVVPITEGRALAERWTGARLVTTRGFGHSRLLHDPEVVEQGVEFVTASPSEPHSTIEVASRAI
jgi:pimeloyl-ACP methyl ester carboxylesterase